MAEAFDSMNVAELKAELKARELPVSGRKSDLIARLNSNSKETEPIFIGELVDNSILNQAKAFLAMPAVVASILVVLIMTSTVAVFKPEWLGLASESAKYQLIDFDADQTRKYAQDLVDLGHPEWKGRMSGSGEEGQAAEYIINNFEEMGFMPEMNNYDVPMFAINDEPEIGYCIPGILAGRPGECSAGDVGRQEVFFTHREQFVLQGYSGSADIQFGQDMQVVDLGNGNASKDWASAQGAVALVWAASDNDGNTDMYIRADENQVGALVLVNMLNNCDLLFEGDCIPIFKGIRVDTFKEERGAIPDNIPFMAISKKAGEELQQALELDARIHISTDVDNTGELLVRVPCGTIYGESDDIIIVGGHHDTVYSGPGAVDDTSGTASVLEMARQIGLLYQEYGTPEKSIRFCTWGGEEEGLWGSRYYVADKISTLTENLELYINLDMNHIDIDYENRGNSIRLFSNSEKHLDHVQEISDIYWDANKDMAKKYEISFALLEGEKGESDGMPYNSDHGPFVYDLDGRNGNAIVCYGSGSWEYHTYLDDMSRFNEESLGISVTIYGTYLRYLAWG